MQKAAANFYTRARFGPRTLWKYYQCSAFINFSADVFDQCAHIRRACTAVHWHHAKSPERPTVNRNPHQFALYHKKRIRNECKKDCCFQYGHMF
jgi:hypothetical protein